MAATANITLRTKNAHAIVRNDHPVKAASIIYAGTAVGEDSGVARALVAGDTFLGFAEDYVDNTDGAAGALRIGCESGLQKQLAVVGASASSIGAAVYASADNTFTLTSSSNSLIGYVREHVSSTTCWVEIIASRG